MALDGGGGGGGPVGVANSFTGPSEALEIIGDHCQAISGTFEALEATQTMISFKSGNFYADAIIQCNGFINTSNITAGTMGAFVIKMNGQTVSILKVTGSAETSPYDMTQNMIIPPYTEVTVECIATGDAPSDLATATIVGRIYRTRD